MKIKIIVMAVILLTAGLLSAQAQKPCGCEDKEALLDLLNQSQIITQEFQFQINLMEEKWIKDSKTIKPTAKGVNDMAKKGLDAAKSVQNYSGFTELMNPVDCSVKRTDTTSDCVELIQKHFFDVTQKVCLASKGTRSADQPYYEVMASLETYLFHLVNAHKLMQNFILQILKSLPKNCRPNGWFGHVFFQQVQTHVTEFNYPPDHSRELARFGGTSTLNRKTTYMGTVLVEGGKAVRVNGYAAYSEDNNHYSSQQMLCNTSDGKVTTVDTGTSKTFTEGAGTGNVGIFELKVHPANKTYDLHAQQFPDVKTTGQTVKWKKSTYPGKARNCGGLESNNTEAKTIPLKGRGHHVTGEKIDPKSPDYLEGSRSYKPDDMNVSYKEGNTGSTTTTFEIQFRWMLRRLPQK